MSTKTVISNMEASTRQHLPKPATFSGPVSSRTSVTGGGPPFDDDMAPCVQTWLMMPRAGGRPASTSSSGSNASPGWSLCQRRPPHRARPHGRERVQRRREVTTAHSPRCRTLVGPCSRTAPAKSRPERPRHGPQWRPQPPGWPAPAAPDRVRRAAPASCSMISIHADECLLAGPGEAVVQRARAEKGGRFRVVFRGGTAWLRCRGIPPAASRGRGPAFPGPGAGGSKGRGCWGSRSRAGCGRRDRRDGAGPCEERA